MHSSACDWRIAPTILYLRDLQMTMTLRQTFSLYDKNPALAELEDFRWTQRAAFTLYGARVGVRTNSAAALRALRAMFPPQWREFSGARVDWLYSLRVARATRQERAPMHSLYSNGEHIAQARDLKPLAETFEREMQLAVAQAARRKVFVHAGVVGWRGRAIVIPGRTFTGKSTLVHALVRAGAEYYSDEYAVLDEQARVHPFARPLALRDEYMMNRKLPYAELGGVIGTRPIPVGTILVAKYRAGANWRPRQLTPGLGTLALLDNTVTARSGQPIVLEILARVAQNAIILKSARGEAKKFAAQLLELL